MFLSFRKKKETNCIFVGMPKKIKKAFVLLPNNICDVIELQKKPQNQF